MSTYEDRLNALREELARRRLDGFVVPLTDEHMSEYVGAYAQRLAWLTGFEGSAGSAVVLPAEAAIFVDGRYTLQVREQVDGALWSYQSVPETSVAEWLKAHASEGARIGYDPWLHSKGWVKAAREALAKNKAELVAVDTNPVDAIWPDRPLPSRARLIIHPDSLAGRNASDKRAAIADELKEKRADTVVLSALDSIAWAFNIRGQDVERTPVGLAYAAVNADGTADLFVDPEKVSEDVVRHLGNAVRVHARNAFPGWLSSQAGKAVLADPDRAVAAIFDALESSGARSSRRAIRSCFPRPSRTRPKSRATRQRNFATALPCRGSYVGFRLRRRRANSPKCRPPSGCTSSAATPASCAT